MNKEAFVRGYMSKIALSTSGNISLDGIQEDKKAQRAKDMKRLGYDDTLLNSGIGQDPALTPEQKTNIINTYNQLKRDRYSYDYPNASPDYSGEYDPGKPVYGDAIPTYASPEEVAEFEQDLSDQDEPFPPTTEPYTAPLQTDVANKEIEEANSYIKEPGEYNPTPSYLSPDTVVDTGDITIPDMSDTPIVSKNYHEKAPKNELAWTDRKMTPTEVANQQPAPTNQPVANQQPAPTNQPVANQQPAPTNTGNLTMPTRVKEKWKYDPNMTVDSGYLLSDEQARARGFSGGREEYQKVNDQILALDKQQGTHFGNSGSNYMRPMTKSEQWKAYTEREAANNRKYKADLAAYRAQQAAKNKKTVADAKVKNDAYNKSLTATQRRIDATDRRIADARSAAPYAGMSDDQFVNFLAGTDKQTPKKSNVSDRTASLGGNPLFNTPVNNRNRKLPSTQKPIGTVSRNDIADSKKRALSRPKPAPVVDPRVTNINKQISNIKNRSTSFDNKRTAYNNKINNTMSTVKQPNYTARNHTFKEPTRNTYAGNSTVKPTGSFDRKKVGFAYNNNAFNNVSKDKKTPSPGTSAI